LKTQITDLKVQITDLKIMKTLRGAPQPMKLQQLSGKR